MCTMSRHCAKWYNIHSPSHPKDVHSRQILFYYMKTEAPNSWDLLNVMQPESCRVRLQTRCTWLSIPYSFYHPSQHSSCRSKPYTIVFRPSNPHVKETQLREQKQEAIGRRCALDGVVMRWVVDGDRRKKRECRWPGNTSLSYTGFILRL